MNKNLYICLFLFFATIYVALGQTNTAIRIKGFYSQLANPTFNFTLSTSNGSVTPLITCWKPASQGSTNPNNLQLVDDVLFYGNIGTSATLIIKAWNTDNVTAGCTIPATALTFSLNNIVGTETGSYYNLTSNPNKFVVKIEATSMNSAGTPLIYYPSGNNRHCLDQIVNAKMLFPNGYTPQSNEVYEWEYFFPPDSTVNPELMGCIQACQFLGGGGLGSGFGTQEGGDPEWCEQNCYNQYKPIPHWKQLNVFGISNTTNVTNVFFTPNWKKFSSSSGYLFDQTRTVYLRARKKTPFPTSAWSNMLHTELMPSAPTFPTNPSNIVITPSCPNGANGIIQVNNVVKSEISLNNYINSYSYILRAGANNFAPVDPLSSNAGSAPLVSGTTTSNNLTIDNLAPGVYTLLLLNPGGSVGTCYSHKDSIVVPFEPILDITNRVSVSHVTCHGGTNGNIQITPVGGYMAVPLQHNIEVIGTNTTFTGTKTVSGRNVTYSNLKAGMYKITVEDFCKQLKTTTIAIKQPPQTLAFINDTIQPSCNNLSNGVVIIKDNTPKETVENYLLNRSDSVSYQLYKNGNTTPIQSNSNYALSVDRKLTLSALEPGNYTVKVRNLATPVACNMDVTLSFTIIPKVPIPALSTTYSQVSCKNGNNGGFQIASADFTNYNYYVRDVLRNRYNPLAASMVDTLKAGNYHLILT